MTGAELVVTVLGVSLVIAGLAAFRFYLNNKLEIRKVQSDDDEAKARISNYQVQQLNDTKRFELLTNALTAQPVYRAFLIQGA